MKDSEYITARQLPHEGRRISRILYGSAQELGAARPKGAACSLAPWENPQYVKVSAEYRLDSGSRRRRLRMIHREANLSVESVLHYIRRIVRKEVPQGSTRLRGVRERMVNKNIT